MALLPTIAALSVVARAEQPLAVPIDGEPFAARLTAVDGQWKLRFEAAGKSRDVAVADLVTWGQLVELRKGPIVLLADGGMLPADVVSADKDVLVADSDRLGVLKLAIDSLAGVIFHPPPGRADLDALADRVARAAGESDRMILDNGDEVTGLIESLENDKLRVKANVGRLEVAVRRVVAVVFNPALRRKPAAQPRAAWIGLGDGTRLQVASLKLEGDRLELTTIGGARWKAAARDLVFLMPLAGRAVYLSDLAPKEYRHLPYLDLPWPYRPDRNVTGGQLRGGGRLYLKGLGVHSAARLSYDLERRWSRFQAELAIDDSTGGRGSVGFRVFVDGKPKFSSGPIRGGAGPQPISIDVRGANRLDLVVDYGEGGDVMDHADWLGARLVK